MTSEQKAAFINAQAACAIIQAMGMLASNQQRAALGDSPAYGEQHFDGLIQSYGLHENSVIAFLRGE